MMLYPTTITRLAPAKINLALRITRRREDGYHLLESLFLPLSWGDTVQVRVQKAQRTEISCDCAPDTTLSGPQNLAGRAAKAYLDARDLRARVEIHIYKRVWVAAGLGGGSSDAAAVLCALSTLDFMPPTEAQLLRLALNLGADVPFFLDPRPARVSGIGEHRVPLMAPTLDLLLLNPQIPLSTADVFSALGLAPGQSLEKNQPSPALPKRLMDAQEAATWVENDLELAAESLCPAIGELREALLNHGALAAGLSGSGPTLFGLFPSKTAAAAAAKELGAKSTSSLVQCSSVCNLTPS